jgi:hypothetical protein
MSFDLLLVVRLIELSSTSQKKPVKVLPVGIQIVIGLCNLIGEGGSKIITMLLKSIGQ